MRVGEGEREDRWEEGGLRGVGVDELEDVGRGRDSIAGRWGLGLAGGSRQQAGRVLSYSSPLPPFLPYLTQHLF